MDRNGRGVLAKIIRSLWQVILLVFCFAVFVAGAGKLVDWMLRQSVDNGKKERKLDIEEEFAQQTEEIRQWIVKEKGVPEEALEVQIQGLTVSFLTEKTPLW